MGAHVNLSLSLDTGISFHWLVKRYIVYRILHECPCFIEFIKQVGEKRLNARLAEHFISFSQRV